MTKLSKVILSLLFLLVLLTACGVEKNHYEIIGIDGAAYRFTGECLASREGALLVTCYSEFNVVALSIQAREFRLLEDE